MSTFSTGGGGPPPSPPVGKTLSNAHFFVLNFVPLVHPSITKPFTFSRHLQQIMNKINNTQCQLTHCLRNNVANEYNHGFGYILRCEL